MNLSAAGIHRVLSVYRTVLLLCVIHLLVNSCARSYPTETGGNRDSVRLEKFKWIAKRLTQFRQDPLVDEETQTAETLASIRSLTAGMGTAHKTIDTATETGDPSDMTTSDRRQTRLEVLKRVYRQAPSNDNFFELFREACVDLNNTTKPFLEELKKKFIPTANKVLNNVVRIPEVFPPNDPAFERKDVPTLVRKMFILEMCLKAVLDRSLKYVKKEHRAWFTTQSRNVEYVLSVAVTATLYLPFETSYITYGEDGTDPAQIDYYLAKALHQLVLFLGPGQRSY